MKDGNPLLELRKKFLLTCFNNKTLFSLGCALLYQFSILHVFGHCQWSGFLVLMSIKLLTFCIFPLWSLNLSMFLSSFSLKFMKEDKTIEVIQVLKHLHSDMLVITYLIFKINYSLIETSVIFVAYQVLIAYFLYRRAEQIYQYFRIMQFALTYEYQFKVFDLLVTLLMMAHTFALILYTSTLYDPSNSWINSISVLNKSYLIQYLYSFYFACTTMLTIGYGDITPKNPVEVIVVVFIQIVGVVIFGYIINEIGHTLSNIRQERDNLEKDLQTIDKIAKYYNLEKDLSNRAKAYVFNNKANSKELDPDQEKNLLLNLNDDLRTEINQNNSLTIVKSSIFFLCHWSKDMQSNVAERLIKRLIAPNQRIIQAAGKQKIYIIKNGKIDIEFDRFGVNKGSRKVLKSIQIESSRTISDNIYGYTSVISNRPVRLEALAKDFTSTYSIDKSGFLECISQNTNDFQYYHEIKNRVDQSSFCEQWEAPAIMNIREHFNPSVTIIIKKLRCAMAKAKNVRQFYMRRSNTQCKSCMIYPSMTRMRDQTTEVDGGFKTLQFFRISPNQINKKSTSQEEDEESENEDINSNSSNSMYLSINRNSLLSVDKEKTNYLGGRKSTIFIVTPNAEATVIFEIGKEFRNFFRRNNITQVLHSFEKQNFAKKQRMKIDY